MNNFKEVREVLKKLDDGIPEYIASNLRWLRIKSTIKEVSKYIPKNAKVLDIGCGMGYNTIMLKIFRPDITIIGIEPSVIEEGRVIANVWKQYTQKGCNYKNGNALHLKSKNEFFDVVISFGVLEHIREYYDFFFEKKVFKDEELRFMQEANRVLKKGGINIITNLPNQYSWTEVLATIINKSAHKYKFTKKQIKNLIKESKFKKILIKKMFFLPAQFPLRYNFLFCLFNKYSKLLNFSDKVLTSIPPLNFFSQSYFIVCKK